MVRENYLFIKQLWLLEDDQLVSHIRYLSGAEDQTKGQFLLVA